MSEQDNSALFDGLESQLGLTNVNRDIVINILMKAVQEGDFNLQDMKASDRESFMSVARELNSTMNSRDSSHINLVKLRLQEKRDEQAVDGSALISEFLRSIKLNSGTPSGETIDPNAADDELTAEFDKRGLEVGEKELLKNGEVEHD